MVDDRLLRRDVTLDDIMQEHARLVGSRSPSPRIPRRRRRGPSPYASPCRITPPYRIASPYRAATAAPRPRGPSLPAVPRSAAEAKALAAYYDVFGRELERKKPAHAPPARALASSSSTADSDEFRHRRRSEPPRSKVFVPAFEPPGSGDELSVLGTSTGPAVAAELMQSDQVLVISDDD